MLYFLRFFSGALLFLLIAASSSTDVLAYRGESIEQLPPLESPAGRLPGYMDAYVAPRGELIFELPTFSLDYGVTDRLTVGANLMATAMILSEAPAFALKTRYLFFSNEKVASSLTLYGGALWMKQANLNNSYFLAATQNTSYYFSSHSILTFHLSLIRMGFSQGSNPMNEANGTLFSVLPGLGYQYYFDDTFGFEAQVLVPVALSLIGETTGSNMNLDIQRSAGYLHRVLLNIRTGRDAVLSLGVGGVLSFANKKESLIPLATFTFAL